MIIKGSTRGSPMGLARHLLNDRDNDHVELHSIRGFVSEDLTGAMHEVHAMSAAVKSKQPLFSISLSPPAHEQAEIGLFESTAAQILERTGLQDQPHALIFHEKEARRHAHLVVSRLDPANGRVIPLPFFKQKLFELSKEIYLQQGWDLPKGFIDKRERDPHAYDLATYQQAKREGLDPKHLKMMAQEAWSLTKDRDQAAFAKELEKRGLYLAKGDRRGHVAVTWRGEVHALPRLLDRKTKEVRQRLGDPGELRSVEETRNHIRTVLEPVMGRLIDEADHKKDRRMEPLDREREAMTAQHRLERFKLDMGQKARRDTEAKERAAQLRKGVAGLWDKISGRYRQIKAQHERDVYAALQSDRAQRQAIVEAQLVERQELQRRIEQVRHRHAVQLRELHEELHRLQNFHQQETKAERRTPPPTPRQALEPEQKRQPASARQAWLEQERQRSGRAAERPAQDSSRTTRTEWLRAQRSRTQRQDRGGHDTGFDQGLD